MALSSPSFTIKFDLDSDSATYKKLVLTDTTDYAGESIDPADVVGYFKITNPLGVTVHEGSFSSPDIDADVSLVFSDEAISLVSSSPLKFLLGTYTITYNIQVSGSDTYSKTTEAEFCPPTTIVSADGEIQDACMTYLINCFCQKITLTDVTVYGDYDSLTRLITLHPPSIAEEPDVTSNNSTLEYTFSYTNAGYEFYLDNLVTYVDGDVTVAVRVEYTISKTVRCDKLNANLLKCISNFFSHYENEIQVKGGSNLVNSKLIADTMALIGKIQSYDANLQIGNWEKVDTLYTEIEAIINEHIVCPCNCDSDEPTLADPFCGAGAGSSGTTYSFVGSSPVVVGVAGTVVTISLTTTFVNKVNSLYNDIITSSDSSLSVSSSTSGTDKTWDVKAKQHLSLKVTIDYTAGTDVSVTTGDVVRQGNRYDSNFPQSGDIQSINYPHGSFPDLEADTAAFFVKNFLTSAPGGGADVPDKIDLHSWEIRLKTFSSGDETQPVPFGLEVYDKDNDGFYVRLFDRVLGMPISWDRFINEIELLNLTVKINQ